ncbi:hypothetical protein [Acidovorax lacteus]|uniref:Lipoprotein n=1 Tax=Acidovorax lacteus TaxID=1924988 RepID=A0ABP8LJ15_9BURK
MLMTYRLLYMIAAAFLIACETPPPRRAVLALDETASTPNKISAVLVSRVNILSKREDGNINFVHRGTGAEPDFSWGAPTDFGAGSVLYLPFTRVGELVAYEVRPGWICTNEIRFGQYYPIPPVRSAQLGNLSKDACVKLQAGEVTYLGDFVIERTGDRTFHYATALTPSGENEVRELVKAQLPGWPVVSKRIDKYRRHD